MLPESLALRRMYKFILLICGERGGFLQGIGDPSLNSGVVCLLPFCTNGLQK